MPELTKTKRLDELKSRFNAGARFTVSKMMREFGITRRTANRDLQDFQELGVALEFEDLPDGHRQWFADIKSRKVLVSYSICDVMSLFLGRRMFDFLENTSLEDSLNRVYRRVEPQLSRPKDLANANKLYQKVYLVHEGPKKLPETAGDILDEVLPGLLYEQRVKVHYVNHKGEDRRFTICPYTLVAYKRGLYLLGKVEEWNGKVLVYSLERIKGAEWLKGEHFEYPEGSNDPEGAGQLRDSELDIVVRGERGSCLPAGASAIGPVGAGQGLTPETSNPTESQHHKHFRWACRKRNSSGMLFYNL